MSMAIAQTFTATGPNGFVSFLASGGTPPYAYVVLPSGAGGAIDSTTGIYTGPPVVPTNPANLFDVIQATDSLAATATAQVLIGTPLLLFCDIIQHEMGLANGRVYLWDQKIMQPHDSDLYVAVSVPSCKPFGNTNRFNGTTNSSDTYVSIQAMVNVDIISRGPSARDRKEEIVLAFYSDYSQKQQYANSFNIGRIPPSGGFVNLSEIDGDAIPYRYRITVMMQYAFTKTQVVDYFDNDFTPVQTYTDD